MRRTRRDLLCLLGAALLVLIGTACLGASDREVSVLADGQPVGDAGAASTGATPTAATLTFTPTPPPSVLDPDLLVGLTMPVEGACLPGNDQIMPNAPRAYRNGVHEGVDFYFGDACVVIGRGTPVLAAADGVVVRADHDYTALTQERAAELDARTTEQGFADEETMDVYRGRQLWIDHGNGIVTRYCQLESIEDDLAVGITVRAGQVVGAIGESGTPESATAPNSQLHLHFEIRIGAGFLGEGLEPHEVRALYEQAFTPGG